MTATFEASSAPSVAPRLSVAAVKGLEVVPVAVDPGGPATAVGRGCPGKVPVIFTIYGKHVGTTTSATDGDFEGPVDTTDLAVGAYEVDAHCGLVLSAPLDIVLASQVSSDTGSIVVIIFFLLLGIALFVRQLRFR